MARTIFEPHIREAATKSGVALAHAGQSRGDDSAAVGYIISETTRELSDSYDDRERMEAYLREIEDEVIEIILDEWALEGRPTT